METREQLLGGGGVDHLAKVLRTMEAKFLAVRERHFKKGRKLELI